jgi:hypothetical protein
MRPAKLWGLPSLLPPPPAARAYDLEGDAVTLTREEGQRFRVGPHESDCFQAEHFDGSCRADFE